MRESQSRPDAGIVMFVHRCLQPAQRARGGVQAHRPDEEAAAGRRLMRSHAVRARRPARAVRQGRRQRRRRGDLRPRGRRHAGHAAAGAPRRRATACARPSARVPLWVRINPVQARRRAAGPGDDRRRATGRHRAAQGSQRRRPAARSTTGSRHSRRSTRLARGIDQGDRAGHRNRERGAECSLVCRPARSRDRLQLGRRRPRRRRRRLGQSRQPTASSSSPSAWRVPPAC